jgi:hypothetical protein
MLDSDASLNDAVSHVHVIVEKEHSMPSDPDC